MLATIRPAQRIHYHRITPQFQGALSSLDRIFWRASSRLMFFYGKLCEIRVKIVCESYRFGICPGGPTIFCSVPQRCCCCSPLSIAMRDEIMQLRPTKHFSNTETSLCTSGLKIRLTRIWFFLSKNGNCINNSSRISNVCSHTHTQITVVAILNS